MFHSVIPFDPLIPCKFASRGCEAVLVEAEIATHENSCRYGKVRCFYDGCNWCGEMEPLLDHLTTHHKIDKVQGKTRYFTMRNT